MEYLIRCSVPGAAASAAGKARGDIIVAKADGARWGSLEMTGIDLCVVSRLPALADEFTINNFLIDQQGAGELRPTVVTPFAVKDSTTGDRVMQSFCRVDVDLIDPGDLVSGEVITDNIVVDVLPLPPNSEPELF